MAQNECLLSSSTNQLHVPKQEPTEFVAYEYPQVDKRSSWAPPGSSSHYGGGHNGSSSSSGGGHKRESSAYMISSSSSSVNQGGSSSSMGGGPIGAAPPHAHAKNTPTGGSGSSWGAPVYRQHQQSSNTPLGSSPGAMLQQQDIYAQGDIYRRSAVFVSQAPYQTYNRVVPPPAHNASSRQVSMLFSMINESLFIFTISGEIPLSSETLTFLPFPFGEIMKLTLNFLCSSSNSSINPLESAGILAKSFSL